MSPLLWPAAATLKARLFCRCCAPSTSSSFDSAGQRSLDCLRHISKRSGKLFRSFSPSCTGRYSCFRSETPTTGVKTQFAQECSVVFGQRLGSESNSSWKFQKWWPEHHQTWFWAPVIHFRSTTIQRKWDDLLEFFSGWKKWNETSRSSWVDLQEPQNNQKWVVCSSGVWISTFRSSKTTKITFGVNFWD